MPALLQAAGSGLSTAELFFLAVVQGLTEFLPISSSGHLALLAHAFGHASSSLWIEVSLHLGTLAAVLVFYRRSVRDIARDALSGRPREALWIALGTLPAVAAGLLAKDAIEAHAHDPRLAGAGLCVTALVLVAGELGRRRQVDRPQPRTLGARGALVIGLAQALAILPGISRSGSTIAAGLLLGLQPAAAARFSFLLSIPAILGASVLTAREAGATGGPGAGALALAVAVSAVVGWFALRFLIAFLGRGAFGWFAAYCALLGLTVLVRGR